MGKRHTEPSPEPLSCCLTQCFPNSYRDVGNQVGVCMGREGDSDSDAKIAALLLPRGFYTYLGGNAGFLQGPRGLQPPLISSAATVNSSFL